MDNIENAIKCVLPITFKDMKAMEPENRKGYFYALYQKYPGIDTTSIAQMLGTTVKILKMELVSIGVTPMSSNGKIASESRKNFKKEMIDVMADIRQGKITYSDMIQMKKSDSVNTPSTSTVIIPEISPDEEETPIKIPKLITGKPIYDNTYLIIKTKNLKPIRYTDFKKLNKEQRKNYLEGLIKKYPGIQYVHIATMLAEDCNADAIASQVYALGIKIANKRANSTNSTDPGILESRKSFCLDMFGKNQLSDEDLIKYGYHRKKAEEPVKPITEQQTTTPSNDIHLEPEFDNNNGDVVEMESEKHESTIKQPETENDFSIDHIDMIDIEIDASKVEELIKILNIKGKIHLTIKN